MNILDLEKDKQQQDFILSIFHATTHTFGSAGAVKIIENHQGSAFIQTVQQVMVQQPIQLPQQPAPQASPFQKKKK